MLKILVIIPIALSAFNELHEKLLQKYASKGFKIVARNVRYGTHSIESHFDSNFNAPYILEQVKKAEEDGFDAVIIDCFDDPALKAARELVKIPVLGPRESALHLASMLGTKFSIITVGGLPVTKMMLPSIEELGLTSRFASIRNIGLMVLELEEDRERTVDRMVEEGKKAIEEDGADVLVIGCTGLSDIAEQYKLQERVGVPVIDPLLAALKVAEALVTLGLSHSKLAYPEPPKKPVTYPPSLKGE